MKVLDVSNYDWPTFRGACLAEAGVVRVIVGCNHLGAARAMVAAARSAGIVCEDLYGFLYFGLEHEQHAIDKAVQVAGELGGIKRIWLDVEASPPHEAFGVTPAQRIAATREARWKVEAAGLRAGIYTGAFYWPPKMGNTEEFSDLPLWLANYGSNDPGNPRPPLTSVAFGGWEQVAVHQYSSSIEVCGRVRDHNYWMLEEEDEMTEEERRRLERLEAIVAGNAVQEVVRPENRELLAELGIPEHALKDGAKVTLVGEAALEYAFQRGFSLALGLRQLQDRAELGGRLPAGTKFIAEVQ